MGTIWGSCDGNATGMELGERGDAFIMQDAAVPLPLEIAADAHLAKACSNWPNEIDAHHADDFAVVQ